MAYFFHTRAAMLTGLSGLTVIVYALWCAAKKKPHDRTMKRLAITFRFLMEVTLFLGVVLIMTRHGGFSTNTGMHVVMMVMAAAVAHVVPAVMRRRPQEERTPLPYAVATAISLGIAAVGVYVLASVRTTLG